MAPPHIITHHIMNARLDHGYVLVANNLTMLLNTL